MIFNKKKAESQVEQILDQLDIVINMSVGGNKANVKTQEKNTAISRLTMRISDYSSVINNEINTLEQIKSRLLQERETLRNLSSNINGQLEMMKTLKVEDPASTLTNRTITMTEITGIKELHRELIALTEKLLQEESK